MIIWKDVDVIPVREVHWDVRFFPVENAPKKVRTIMFLRQNKEELFLRQQTLHSTCFCNLAE